MRRQILVSGVVVLLVVSGTIALFVFPVSPERNNDPVELGDSETFVSTGHISVEGKLLERHEAMVGENTAHLVFEYMNGTREVVSHDGVVYTKYEAHVDNEDWFERTKTDDAEVIYSGEQEDQLIRVMKQNATPESERGVVSSEMRSTRSMIFSGLRTVDYEIVGAQNESSRTVYKPESRWEKTTSDTYRNSPESGELRVDSETEIVRTASLRVTVTEASSYGEYLLRSSNSETLEVQYEYDPDPVEKDIEKPEWVVQCLENDQWEC